MASFYVASVYYPTTKECTILPPCLVSNGVFNVVHGVILAYDPSKSPHYKVICVRDCDFFEEGHYRIEVYSSEIGHRRQSGGAFSPPDHNNLRYGVFWNGAINWISYWGNSLFFDVDEEKQHECQCLLFLTAMMMMLIIGGLCTLEFGEEENDEDSYLVVNLPKKVVRYKFNDKSFEKLHDFTRVGTEVDTKLELVIEYNRMFMV
ncbi:hypothetical protein EZV62_005516 [Acer yangbiense]|uniref:Uncharacterized protein n=1 Tax=Acer yangbiense TaxID=1000413 RepID=A0A5C7IMU8_9ROSI|nr:hypothetical protein EZV62_005516 [Acer yangbiense]